MHTVQETIGLQILLSVRIVAIYFNSLIGSACAPIHKLTSWCQLQTLMLDNSLRRFLALGLNRSRGSQSASFTFFISLGVALNIVKVHTYY